jgi:hypothetical protein
MRPNDLRLTLAPLALTLWLGALGCSSSSTDCFGPGQELETAYEPGTVGCACNSATDKPECLQDSFGQNVALVCTNNAWQAIQSASCPRTTP